ncbi:Zinc knuckle CX2CX4HX4C [Sesbania bispinosa]|nr:Zinc knuckle CX2CX4HX4C [Sesbania bispinosa]
MTNDSSSHWFKVVIGIKGCSGGGFSLRDLATIERVDDGGCDLCREENALAGIWCNPKGLKVEEISDEKFQFLFDETRDGDRVLQCSPWIFRNAWLSLKRWECGQELKAFNFSVVPLNMQIWGLPLHCRTTKMETKIGACMGEVRDSEVFEIKEKGFFVKVLIKFDTTKPLKAGINVGSRDDGVSWVDFRYEKLPQFCYSCGLVGSLKKQNENQEEPALGPWLRASQFGRRIQSQDYRKSAPSHPGRSREKLSKDLLDMLSALSVTKKHVAVVENQER